MQCALVVRRRRRRTRNLGRLYACLYDASQLAGQAVSLFINTRRSRLQKHLELASYGRFRWSDIDGAIVLDDARYSKLSAPDGVIWSTKLEESATRCHNVLAAIQEAGLAPVCEQLCAPVNSQMRALGMLWHSDPTSDWGEGPFWKLRIQETLVELSTRFSADVKGQYHNVISDRESHLPILEPRIQTYAYDIDQVAIRALIALGDLKQVESYQEDCW
jgi:hypothetical protein